MGQVQEGIQPQQEVEIIRRLKRFSQGAGRLDRIMWPPVGPGGLEQRGHKTQVPLARQRNHGEAVWERRKVIASLVGRIPRRDKEDPIQSEFACRHFRGLQVSSVDGIEGTAK
jgi:hypothetical protein